MPHTGAFAKGTDGLWGPLVAAVTIRERKRFLVLAPDPPTKMRSVVNHVKQSLGKAQSSDISCEAGTHGVKRLRVRRRHTYKSDKVAYYLLNMSA